MRSSRAIGLALAMSGCVASFPIEALERDAGPADDAGDAPDAGPPGDAGEATDAGPGQDGGDAAVVDRCEGNDGAPCTEGPASGRCVSGACCLGCVTLGECVAGDRASACGAGGEACAPCAAPRPTCRAGVCGAEVLVQQVSAGQVGTCAVTADERLLCWGDAVLLDGPQTALPVDLSDGERWSSVSVGAGDPEAHACAIRADGVAHCWGANDSGQAGRLPASPLVARPTAIDLPGARFDEIAAGAFWTICRQTDGSLWSFGNNDSWRLGADRGGCVACPSERLAFAHGFDRVAAGLTAGLAIGAGAAAGDAYGWGSFAPLRGDGATHLPAVFGALYTDVSVGAVHGCGVANGRLLCWGGNADGQVGGMDAYVDTPRDVGGGPWQQVSAGLASTCAVASSGALFCWGSNTDGRLGVNDAALPGSAEPLEVMAGTPFRQVSVGSFHACAISAIDELYCWGSNAELALGYDGVARSLAPRLVAWAP